MLLQPLPEVMRVGFRHASPFAVLPEREGRQFPLPAGEDVAVAFLEILVLARGESFAFAVGDFLAGLLQEPLHIARPGIAIGLDDKGELAQQMRPTEPMITVLIGEIGRPAVMDDDPSIARDDTDGGHRLQSPLLVHELQRDLPCRAHVDPMVVLVDAQGGLIDVDRRLDEDPIDGHLLPALEREMELEHVLEDRGLGDQLADEAVDRVLHAFERDHLGNEEVQHVRLDARAVLQRAAERLGERCDGPCVALRTILDLGIHVAEDFLEDDVDLGASLVSLRGDLAQIFPAVLAKADRGDFDGLDRAGVGRAPRLVRLALGVGTGAGNRGRVLFGPRGGLAGVRAGLAGVLFHEHRHQHLKQHQQRLEQGAALGGHLPLGAQRCEATLERLELLAQGLRVDARHESGPSRLLAGLDAHQRREHRQTLRRRQSPIAPPPALGLALDALPVGVVLACVTRPVHPLGAEVEPQLLGAHAGVVHHLQLQALPPAKPLIVQRGRVAGEDHLTGQPPQQAKKLHVILRFVVESVTPIRAARRVQIRRIAVDELPAPIVKVGQEAVRAPQHPLHRIVALELLQRALIEIDPDVAQRRRLALHDRPAAEVALDIGVVRGHQRDDRLAQPRGRFRAEIRAHRRRTRTLQKMGRQRRFKSLRCQASPQRSARA